MCWMSDCRKSTHTACRPHCPVVPKALFTDFLHFTPSLPLPPPVTWDHLPSKLLPLGEKDTHVRIYVYSICHYVYTCTYICVQYMPYTCIHVHIYVYSICYMCAYICVQYMPYLISRSPTCGEDDWHHRSSHCSMLRALI